MSKSGKEATGHDGASMDQVRELLFGSQMKEMEVRMQRQEDRFQREIATTKDTLRQRLDSLENFMKSEVASLLNRVNAEKAERESVQKDAKREVDEALRNEQRERKDALAQAAKDLASAADVFERKISSLSQQLDSVERELRQLLLAESNSLSNKTEERYQQALEVVQKTADNIRHDMVHRNALSGLFTETAVKLSGQWAALEPVVPEPPAEDPEDMPDA